MRDKAMADGGLMSTYGSLVDDRVDQGVFRVDRSIYTDQGVFDAEMERLYERGWVYLCHESQVPEAGCYFATEIGRQPVVVTRQKDFSLKTFINACSHRGAKASDINENFCWRQFLDLGGDRSGNDHCIVSVHFRIHQAAQFTALPIDDPRLVLTPTGNIHT